MTDNDKNPAAVIETTLSDVVNVSPLFPQITKIITCYFLSFKSSVVFDGYSADNVHKTLKSYCVYVHTSSSCLHTGMQNFKP